MEPERPRMEAGGDEDGGVARDGHHDGGAVQQVDGFLQLRLPLLGRVSPPPPQTPNLRAVWTHPLTPRT